jgi:hypothetical protein
VQPLSAGSNPTPHGLSPGHVGSVAPQPQLLWPGGVPPRPTQEGAPGGLATLRLPSRSDPGWVYNSAPQVGPSVWSSWLDGSSSHYGGNGSQDA